MAMAQEGDNVLEKGNGLNKKLAWFERKVKAKLTAAALVLVTVAFYVVVLAKLDLEYFTYYAAVVTLLIGAFSGADVWNTVAHLKSKGGANAGTDS